MFFGAGALRLLNLAPRLAPISFCPRPRFADRFDFQRSREMQVEPNFQTKSAQKQIEQKAVRTDENQTLATGSQRVLGAGEWLRAVTGFQAPFGHDGMPTVWG